MVCFYCGKEPHYYTHWDYRVGSKHKSLYIETCTPSCYAEVYAIETQALKGTHIIHRYPLTVLELPRPDYHPVQNPHAITYAQLAHTLHVTHLFRQLDTPLPFRRLVHTLPRSTEDRDFRQRDAEHPHPIDTGGGLTGW